MSDELSMKDLQMTSLTEKIEVMLKGLEKSKRKELDLAEIGSRLRDCQGVLEGAQLELNHFGVHQKRAEFTKIFRDHKDTLKELKMAYKHCKDARDKHSLMDGAKPNTTGADIATASGLMGHGLDVQQAGTDALNRTRRVIHEAQHIGIDINDKLSQNTEQIGTMYDNLTAIDSTLARSTQVIKRLARRMATDKVIWVFALLVFAAIVFIIIYKNVKKSSGNDGETLVPDTTPIVTP